MGRYEESSYTPAYEGGRDRVFRNVGIHNSDAEELPRRKHTTFRTRWKFEIKNVLICWKTLDQLNRYFSAKLLSLLPTREVDSVFSEMFSTSPQNKQLWESAEYTLNCTELEDTSTFYSVTDYVRSGFRRAVEGSCALLEWKASQSGNSHLQGSRNPKLNSWISWSKKTGPIYCPETSAVSYKCTPPNIPQE